MPAVSQAGSGRARRRADYGFDAPLVPVLLATAGVVLALVGIGLLVWSGRSWSAIGPLLAALVFLLSAGMYVYTTRAGKFAVWRRLLADAGLRGDERLLDMGCGRGAVLIEAARLLPAGKAVGLDLWRSVDQTGNRLETTLANAEAEGVGDRVELHTGDMRRMPFPDGAFGVVVSSVAIHNIHPAADRDLAIDGAVRVLRPGGRLIVADISAAPAYARRLQELGMEDVRRQPLGWRFWYGGPWVAASAVTARKPAGG
jgi:arsenite methyltransferase